MLTHACSPEVGLLQDVIKCDINNLRSEPEERPHVPRSQMVHTQYLLHYIFFFPPLSPFSNVASPIIVSNVANGDSKVTLLLIIVLL